MHATPGCTAKKESACNIARGRNAEAKNHVGGSISLCTEGVPRGHRGYTEGSPRVRRGVCRPSDFFDERLMSEWSEGWDGKTSYLEHLTSVR